MSDYKEMYLTLLSRFGEKMALIVKLERTIQRQRNDVKQINKIVEYTPGNRQLFLQHRRESKTEAFDAAINIIREKANQTANVDELVEFIESLKYE